MNIFVTNTCPYKSAAALDDKRVVKMILESAQMLCTALRVYGVTDKSLYRSTHTTHPCNVWVRRSRSNYMWLYNHLEALCDTYSKSYNKMHKCEGMISHFVEHYKVIPDAPLTPFANCAANQSLGVSFKHIQPTTKAYQMYLNARWAKDKRKPTWTGRSKPKWSEI